MISRSLSGHRRRLINIGRATRLQACVTPFCLRSSPRLNASTESHFGFSSTRQQDLQTCSRAPQCYSYSSVAFPTRFSISSVCVGARRLATSDSLHHFFSPRGLVNTAHLIIGMAQDTVFIRGMVLYLKTMLLPPSMTPDSRAPARGHIPILLPMCLLGSDPYVCLCTVLLLLFFVVWS